MNRVSEQYNKLHCIAHHDDPGGAAWFAKCCSGELKQWPGGGVLKKVLSRVIRITPTVNFLYLIIIIV